MPAASASPPSETSFSSWYFGVISGRARGTRPALARAGLWLASILYGLAARLRGILFDRGWKEVVRAGAPVISVGNLTAGGTGKTPMVEYVAAFYRQAGLRVAILSRGYGSDAGRNDEALVLEENLPDVPHLQGPDRAALAATAVEELESEVLVLDDGFQHRRLARDLDLVLVDATNPWGYGHLLPRGLLRESPRALRRASALVVTRADQARPEDLEQLRGTLAALGEGKPIVLTRHQPVELMDAGGGRGPLDALRDRTVAAFCGIGNPGAFHRTLVDLGARVAQTWWLDDHHSYTRADVQALEQWASRLPEDALVITTQKDLVKLRLTHLGGRPLHALRILVRVDEGEEHFQTLLRGAAPSVSAPDTEDQAGPDATLF